MNALATSKDFIFKGAVWKNCGTTGAQKSALAADQAFSKTMAGDYATTFAKNQGLMDNLSNNLSSVISAGVGQQGMSPQELAAQNSQAINAAAGSNQKIQTAIGEQNAGRSNATPGVESGIESAERAQAATDVDTSLNNTEANITQKNYDLGRQNYWNAVGEQEKVPGAFEDPSSQMASAVTGADKSTSDQANQNAATGQAWMGLVSGLAGDAAGAFACVTPDTQILTPDGYKSAVDLHEGDMLYGLEGDEEIIGLDASLQPIVRLTLENGFVINVSESHTFSTPKGGYVTAKNAANKALKTTHGDEVVNSVDSLGTQPVIKIRLSGQHAYVSNGIWSLE